MDGWTVTGGQNWTLRPALLGRPNKGIGRPNKGICLQTECATNI